MKKRDISLAELDYGNWQGNPDFDIEIYETVEGGSDRAVSGEIRDKVIESLQVVPKFLGDQLYHPGDVVIDVLEESSSRDYFLKPKSGGRIDSTFEWVRVNLFGGKVRTIVVDREKGPSSRLEAEEFYDDLVDVAIKTGKYKDLLFNHERCISNEKKTSLGIKIQKKIREKSSISRGFTGVVAGTSSVVALAFIGIAIASIFPPISSGVAAVAFLVAAVVPTVIASVSGYFSLKRIFLGRRIKEMRKEQEAVDDEMAKKYAGIDALRDELQNIIDTNGDVLDLANKSQQDKSARVIARWINTKAAESCKVVTLSGNEISDKGVAKLARVLAVNHSVRTVDLRRLATPTE